MDTKGSRIEEIEAQPRDEKNLHDHHDVIVDKDLMSDAFKAENHEHEMGIWEAAKTHPAACFWAFIMAFTIVSSALPLSDLAHMPIVSVQVMESFDMFLNGNFVALPSFKEKYGVFVEGSGYTIPTRWQSALFQAGQCGAFVGVFMAGPITNRIGYRWTTIIGLMLMNATIFISFFVSISTPRLCPATDACPIQADSLSVFVIGQFFEGTVRL